MRSETNKILSALVNRQKNFSMFVLEAGWPFRSFEAVVRSDIYLLPWGDYAIQPDPILAGVRFDDDRWLPLQPLMPGFLLNSLFFALVLWPITLAPDAIRKALRRAGGQCPGCGCPIGVDSICEQCGQELGDFWGDSRQ